MLIAALLLSASSVTAAEDVPICPDRPSKANGTCTVPAGHFQLETSLVDWTHDKFADGHLDFTMWGSSVIKYGLNDSADVELGITPYESLRVREDGIRDRASGVGDMIVRLKQRLTSDESPIQAALIPFAKLPTAGHDLGNGKVEGGVTVPVNTALGKSGVTLTIGPELDVRADSDEHGYHAAMAQLINFGFAVTKRLSLSAELWGQWDWDPSGTVRQYSADGSIAYLVNSDLQVDAGANVGLNRNTPDVELYAGVSKRF